MTRATRLALGLALAAAACGQGAAPAAPPSATGSAAVAAPAAPVAAAPFLGVVTPRAAIDVVAPFTTRVTSVTAATGAAVEAGAVLLRLDERPLREQLAVARASLRGAEADRVRAQIDRKAAESALTIERNSLAAGLVAQADLDAADYAAQRAVAGVTRATLTIEEQRTAIGVLEAKLKDSELRAPIAGVVAQRYAEPGATVAEGTPLVRVITDGEVVIKFAVPASQRRSVAVGGRVDVELGDGGAVVEAVISSVSPELDPVAQMILGEAVAVDAAAALAPGTVCRVRPR